MDALEFTGEFGVYTVLAVSMIVLGYVAFLGLKLIYRGWLQAQTTAAMFCQAIDPKGNLTPHERAVLGLSIIVRVTTFLTIVSLVALHESFFAWLFVSNLTWGFLKVRSKMLGENKQPVRLVA